MTGPAEFDKSRRCILGTIHRTDEPFGVAFEPAREPSEDEGCSGSSIGDEAIRAVEDLSRRIDVLARRLNLQSHLDDGDPDSGPRAA